MNSKSVTKRIELKNILYLTDFSEPSEAALPYAGELARGYDAKIHVLHVLLPPLFGYASPQLTQSEIEVWEERAKEQMQRVESQLSGTQSDSSIERGLEIWPVVERAIHDQNVEMIVLGTHGRTGPQRMLLGSVAEEIFRRSPVPVLTIGPHVRTETHNAAKFHRVVMAMDFTPAALAALPYAFSIAAENESRIYLLNAIPHRDRHAEVSAAESSAADAMHRLHDLAADDDELWCRPHAVVRYGNAAEQILDASRELGADLIVLGARPEGHDFGAATHVKRATAHAVVARARCPVLTVALS